jgi:hypothetical protein
MKYQFTSEQLVQLLSSAINSYQEHLDKHGKDEEMAEACAIGEVFDGMASERELLADGVNLEPSHTLVSEDTP